MQPTKTAATSALEDLKLKARLDILIQTKGYIQMDEEASPAILAGILGIPVPMVYQGRQDGKLPASSESSYRDAIQHYINFYKKKMNSRSTSMSEAKLVQDIRNGIAKEEQQWLEIKRLKEELLEAAELKILFEPIFHLIRASLVTLARKHPKIQKDIDNMMASWDNLGAKIEAQANIDGSAYVQSMLEKELNLLDAEEKVIGTFGITPRPEEF